MYCKKIISTKPNLIKHLNICKFKPDDEIIAAYTDFFCIHCKKIISAKSNLERHLTVCRIKIENIKQQLKEKNKLCKKYKLESIRSHARITYKKYTKVMNCVHCNHSGSTEVCHIKAISEFDKLSSREEINHISNLVGLCPNCHVDLDRHKKFEVVRTVTLHSMLVKHLNN